MYKVIYKWLFESVQQASFDCLERALAFKCECHKKGYDAVLIMSA